MNETANSLSVVEAPPSPPVQTAPGPRRNLLGWLADSWPTVLVLALLGGLAYWGHYTGWTIPRFSALIGGEAPEKDDWCNAHAVPESVCVECNESLLPKGKSFWCRTHGVPNCPFEHPEIAQVKTPPQITTADLERARRALELKERPENNPRCKLHLRRLQFASEEVLDKMGIDIAPVWEAPMEETVSASGEILYEQPRVAPLAVPVPGRVWRVTDRGRIGAFVHEGDVLALVDAPDVGKAKSELLQALAQVDLRARTVERLRPLAEASLSRAQFLEAEATLREAQIRLVSAQQALVNLGLPVQADTLKGLSPEALGKYVQFLGLPDDLARGLDSKTTTANLMPLKASRDGIVTAVRAVAGEMVDPSKTLFVVTDNSQMWLMLHVRIEDMKYVRVRDARTGKPGQVVRFHPDGLTQEVTGELVWRSTAVDEKTRTVQVRADLSNPDGLLQANSFGTGAIVLREEINAVVVPNEAVHWEGDCTVVFVRDRNFLDKGAPKIFHVRTVRPGARSAQYTEVIAGVLPGEVVATRNSAALRAEMLKNRLGEG